MNICLWSSASFEKPYASYHLIHEIIKSMLKDGHKVWLIQMQYEDGSIPDDISNDVDLINIPMTKTKKSNFAERYLQEILYFFRSYKKIKRIKGLDCIFLQSTNAAFVPICICNRKRIPLLYNVQDIFPMDAMLAGKLSKNGIAYKILSFLQREAYIQADRVVTISDDLAKTISREIHNRRKIDVIYNWSYQNEGYTIPDADNHFLKTYNITQNDEFRVVYAGNVGQMIDIEMFLNVSEKMKNYKDIVFYIIGEGSNLANLQRKVSEKKLENVKFYPSQPMEYAPDNYCMADVNIIFVPKGVIYTCMPSKTNICLLSQKPTIVAIDLDSEMAKKLQKVDSWFVVESGDASKMVSHIKTIYSDCAEKKSNNSVKFLNDIGAIENSMRYVDILKKMLG